MITPIFDPILGRPRMRDGGGPPVVSTGGLVALTTEQQAVIVEGTLVTTTDGHRWIYTGTGSKTSEASYIHSADITPEWSAIANKPSTFAPIIGNGAGDAVAGNDSRLSDAREPTSHSHATSDITNFAADAAAAAPVQDNDSRLSDARTPTAHKASHQTGGGDALSPSDIGAEPALGNPDADGKVLTSTTGGGRSWTALPEGGGIGDTSTYVIAQPGDNLVTKYGEAKLLTPNGSAKSLTNRAALVIMPGNYTLSGTLQVNENFVDVLALGAGSFAPSANITGTITVSARYVTVVGIKCTTLNASTQTDIGGGNYNFGGGQFYLPNHGLSVGARVLNTGDTAGDIVFGAVYTVSDVPDNNSIQLEGVSGVWTDDPFSVSVYGSADQKYINCYAGVIDGSVFGTFVGCSSPAFAAYAGLSGGFFYNCIAPGWDQFSMMGSVYGIFTDCLIGSLNNGASAIYGKFYNCRTTLLEWPTVSSGGLTRNCYGPDNVVNNQG